MIQADIRRYDRGEIRRVGNEGRIYIPAEVRHILGIKDGDDLEIYIENNRVVMQRVSKQSNDYINTEDLKSSLKKCGCFDSGEIATITELIDSLPSKKGLTG